MIKRQWLFAIDASSLRIQHRRRSARVKDLNVVIGQDIDRRKPGRGLAFKQLLVRDHVDPGRCQSSRHWRPDENKRLDAPVGSGRVPEPEPALLSEPIQTFLINEQHFGAAVLDAPVQFVFHEPCVERHDAGTDANGGPPCRHI